MEIFGLIPIVIACSERFILLAVDDFSLFTWTMYLSQRKQLAKTLKKSCHQILISYGEILEIRSLKSKEFDKEEISDVCNSELIKLQCGYTMNLSKQDRNTTP